VKKNPIEAQALRFLSALGEHADTVVILASVPGKNPGEETKMVSVWQGNQFAAEYMASNFSTFPDNDDDDDEPSRGDPRVPS
jgi:hypothetical protein